MCCILLDSNTLMIVGLLLDMLGVLGLFIFSSSIFTGIDRRYLGDFDIEQYVDKGYIVDESKENIATKSDLNDVMTRIQIGIKRSIEEQKDKDRNKRLLSIVSLVLIFIGFGGFGVQIISVLIK